MKSIFLVSWPPKTSTLLLLSDPNCGGCLNVRKMPCVRFQGVGLFSLTAVGLENCFPIKYNVTHAVKNGLIFKLLLNDWKWICVICKSNMQLWNCFSDKWSVCCPSSSWSLVSDIVFLFFFYISAAKSLFCGCQFHKKASIKHFVKYENLTHFNAWILPDASVIWHFHQWNYKTEMSPVCFQGENLRMSCDI